MIDAPKLKTPYSSRLFFKPGKNAASSVHELGILHAESKPCRWVGIGFWGGLLVVLSRLSGHGARADVLWQGMKLRNSSVGSKRKCLSYDVQG